MGRLLNTKEEIYRNFMVSDPHKFNLEIKLICISYCTALWCV